MVNRTLQYQNGSFFTVVPRALIEIIGLSPGDKVSLGIENGKITIAPATAAKQVAGAANTPEVEMVA